MTVSDSQTCHRCDVEMTDDGEWFVCPCCRTRTRGIERQEARTRATMAELGMNEDEYMAHCRSLFDPTPLPPAALERVVARMAEQWTPACEHDTENPFVPTEDASGV